MEKLSYRLDELAEATGIGRSAIYADISAGKLRVRKRGKITVVLAEEAKRYLDSLPEGTGEPPIKRTALRPVAAE